MRIETVEWGRSAILRLKGEFDTFQCAGLAAALEALRKKGIVRVGLDARLLTFVNSTALGAILKARRDLQSSAGELVLCRPSPFVRRLLAAVGLERILRVFEEEEEVRAHFAEGGAREIPEGEALDDEEAAIAALVRGALERLDPGFLFFVPESAAARRALGREVGVARLLEVDGEGVAFRYGGGTGRKVGAEEARGLFALGARSSVKFRLPLYRREGFFEIPVAVEEAQPARDGSVRVRARFEALAEADRAAIGQFAADMRSLKGEVRGAGPG